MRALGRTSVLRFSAVALVIYGALMLPWLGLARAYESLFRLVYGPLFAVLGFGYNVNIQPNPTEYNGDTLISAMMPLTDHGWYVTCDSMLGFWPLCVFAALLLATPIAVGRKWKAFRNGFLLLHAFVLVRVGLMLLEANAAHPRFCTLEHGGLFASERMAAVLRRLNAELANDLVMILVPAVLTWLFVAFRREDWDTLLARDGSLLQSGGRPKMGDLAPPLPVEARADS